MGDDDCHDDEKTGGEMSSRWKVRGWKVLAMKSRVMKWGGVKCWRMDCRVVNWWVMKSHLTEVKQNMDGLNFTTSFNCVFYGWQSIITLDLFHSALNFMISSCAFYDVMINTFLNIKSFNVFETIELTLVSNFTFQMDNHGKEHTK